MIVADLPPVQQDIPAEIWKMTNEYREELGIPALVVDPDLTLAAEQRLVNVRMNNNLSHSGFDNFIIQGNYALDSRPLLMGENLSCGFADAQESFEQLTLSPTHRANIVDGRFKSIGVATIQTEMPYGRCKGHTGIIVVQLFGAV